MAAFNFERAIARLDATSDRDSAALRAALLPTSEAAPPALAALDALVRTLERDALSLAQKSQAASLLLCLLGLAPPQRGCVRVAFAELALAPSSVLEEQLSVLCSIGARVNNALQLRTPARLREEYACD